jgi:hypothetical protein
VLWKPVDGGGAVEIRSSAKGEEFGEPRPIRVLREDGTDITARMPAEGVFVRLGSQRGPHSGDDQCVMRYDIAGGYVAVSAPEVRYRVTEQFGMQLCRQSLGKGINELGRTPQSRYGDSDVARGNCFHQVLVNDAVAPPKR